MKFFWKIFFTTMFVSVICLAVGGYFITSYNFRTLLNTSVQSSYDFGDIVFQSLSNELKSMDLLNRNMEALGNDASVSKKISVENVAKSIDINKINQNISFCLISGDKIPVFSSLNQNFDKDNIDKLQDNQRGWTLKETPDSIYVQSIRPAMFGEDQYYIETLQDVGYVFRNQRSQYIMFLNIVFVMLVVAGVITFFVSKLLMRQVVLLTKVTKDISAGNLGERVAITGDDEFSMLSENFNRMADDLEDKILQLEDETERKELFVGDFSHELKTPLTSIIGYADMLRSKDMNRERVKFCAEYIFTEGKRLESLSMRLLELIVLRNQEIQLGCISISELFNQVESVIASQLKNADIKLDVDLESAVLSLEPELMKTVFINLIDNARKAIEHSGRISVVGKKNGQDYVISIEDNGKGMKNEVLSKINEAFFMVDKSRSRKQGGAGLGLSICDEIIKLHGFEIEFKSMINVGTEIIVNMKGACNEKHIDEF